MSIKKKKYRIRQILSLLFSITGILSILYILYDLRYPNHFTGDMYGLELMFRGFVLAIVALIMVVGIFLVMLKKARSHRALSLFGLWMIIISSSVLIFMAVQVSLSRQRDDIRKTYSTKSVVELIQIVVEEKDQYAIYAIVEKRDTTAVPHLFRILLDEEQDLNIRMESAHAIGQIGGNAANKALAKAQIEIENNFLLETINIVQKSTSTNDE